MKTVGVTATFEEGKMRLRTTWGSDVRVELNPDGGELLEQTLIKVQEMAAVALRHGKLIGLALTFDMDDEETNPHETM